MKNFLITAVFCVLLIFISYLFFRKTISGPTRHNIYEKYFSSFAKLVIFLFVASLILVAVITLILYKTQFIVYINIIEPLALSIFVGLIVSIVPTRGSEDKKHTKL